MAIEETQVLIGAGALDEADRLARGLALKRVLDGLLGAALLVLAAPLLILTALAVRCSSPGPVLFRQWRVGVHGRRFRMLKFRTMEGGAELRAEELAAASGPYFFKIAEDPRITPVGRWLRRASLDELPQLLHVVTGEMSLVGPRPILERDFERLPARQRRLRARMRPGITGLWQVGGRSLLRDEERLRLDLEYVERWSLLLDLEILLRTVPAVLAGRGAA